MSVILLLVGRNVALRKESVDRNRAIGTTKRTHIVALRKESVDRNLRGSSMNSDYYGVALRKESVDRNY